VESTGISFPHITGEDFVAHLAVSVGPRRSAAQQHLADHSVSTDIHYPIPDHLQVAFGKGSFPDLPITERLVKEILTLPLFPEMLEEEIQRVEDALATFSPER
jgi:dTDP-4-amino-4,6-dideoxygalactose transaminase